MDNEEVEFIAENEVITIIPNFQYKTLYLIGVSQISNSIVLLIFLVKRTFYLH